MFSTRGHIDHVVIEPYDKQVEAFNRAVAELIAIAPTPASVDSLPDEEAQLAFVQAFRAILRLHNVLQTFAEFTFADLMMPRQMFEDFKSKYLDLRDATRSRDEPNLESILQDVDFELELVHQDTINVSYILSLLGELAEAERDGPTPQSETRRADIQRMLDTDIELRSKRELIEEFIESWLPSLKNSDDVRDAYGRYMSEKREKALDDLCKSQGLKRDETETIVANMVYRKSQPLEQELEAAMVNDLDILEREEKLDSALLELREFGEKFDLS
jgi:type I restriction enzyme R subunit